MKTFISKLFIWLPLAFLILAIVDMFFLQEYFFKTRYSVLQTPALAGLTISYVFASILEMMNRRPATGLRYIYKWYVALPVVVLLILITLSSMNR